MGIEDLTEFEKRAVQMEYAVPLIRDLQRILGEDVVNAALEQRIEDAVAEARKSAFDATRIDLGEGGAATMERYGKGIPFDYDVLTRDHDHFDVNVTRCGYAEMMERLGARDVGHLLICHNDFPRAEQVGLELVRTQTCMQGAAHCDFRYQKRGARRAL